VMLACHLASHLLADPGAVDRARHGLDALLAAAA
jgi:hypothetical protein